MPEATTCHAYVGTFELRGEGSGLRIIEFDMATGAIVAGDTVPVSNPSHLAIAVRRGMLFAAAHTAAFEGEPGGAVIAFRIDSVSGALTRANHQIVPFPHPNYIVIDRDQALVLVSSGLGGGVSAFPLGDDGALLPSTTNLLAEGQPMLKLGETLQNIGGEEFVKRRALSTSPHTIMVDPAGRFAVVTDAGQDRLLLYAIDHQHGTLGLHQALAIKTKGTAPRHAVFHPNGKALYVVNEADSSVTTFAFDSAMGQLTEQATFASLPAGREVGNAMGDIKIDSTGRYLYCTNRGDESVSIFAATNAGKRLERIDVTPCGGVHPRGLCFSPDERFLLVANQGPSWRIDRPPEHGSPDAGVAVFAIDADTGKLSATGHSVQIDSATCIAFNG